MLSVQRSCKGIVSWADPLKIVEKGTEMNLFRPQFNFYSLTFLKYVTAVNRPPQPLISSLYWLRFTPPNFKWNCPHYADRSDHCFSVTLLCFEHWWCFIQIYGTDLYNPPEYGLTYIFSNTRLGSGLFITSLLCIWNWSLCYNLSVDQKADAIMCLLVWTVFYTFVMSCKIWCYVLQL